LDILCSIPPVKSRDEQLEEFGDHLPEIAEDLLEGRFRNIASDMGAAAGNW
jgi:hypothetical protein